MKHSQDKHESGKLFLLELPTDDSFAIVVTAVNGCTGGPEVTGTSGAGHDEPKRSPRSGDRVGMGHELPEICPGNRAVAAAAHGRDLCGVCAGRWGRGTLLAHVPSEVRAGVITHGTHPPTTEWRTERRGCCFYRSEPSAPTFDEKLLEFPEADEFVEFLHYVNMSDTPLPTDAVNAARHEEVQWIRAINLYDKVPRSVATSRGFKPETIRWVDVNRGDDENMKVRSRLVARQLKARAK